MIFLFAYEEYGYFWSSNVKYWGVSSCLMNNQSDPRVFTGVFVNPACVSIIDYVNEKNLHGSINRVDV